MRINNHTGIFAMERRIRGFGDVRLPGDGITYPTLGWGIGGVLIGLAASIPITGLLAFAGVPILLTPFVLAAIGALIAARIGGRTSSDGRPASRRLITWARHKTQPALILDGRAHRTRRIHIQHWACISPRNPHPS